MSQTPSSFQEARFGALTIGNFDGVHRGHRSLLASLRAEANRVGGPAVVLTFDPPPLKLLRPDLAPPPLTTADSKWELLLEAGADSVITLATTTEMLQVEAEDFFDQIILRDLQAKTVVEGGNFRFGKGRRGDTALLQSMCASHGIDFQTVAPEKFDGEWVSSTRIRELICNGKLRLANQLLQHPHRICGTVGTGAKRGRTIGFPTANIENIPVLIPESGVYAARVRSTDTDADLAVGKMVALHIGPNPTFGESAKKVEAHILDYSGDLYGAFLELDVLSEIRSVQKFASKDELLEQLNRDVEAVRKMTAWDGVSI